jgi:GT2 family glycosyltransferase
VEPNRGQSDAINKGMRVATGEIVGWLNADDVFLPGALAKVAEAFEKNPDAVVVYGVRAKTDLEGREIKRVPFRKFCPKRLSYAFEAVQPAIFFAVMPIGKWVGSTNPCTMPWIGICS